MDFSAVLRNAYASISLMFRGSTIFSMLQLLNMYAGMV